MGFDYKKLVCPDHGLVPFRWFADTDTGYCLHCELNFPIIKKEVNV